MAYIEQPTEIQAPIQRVFDLSRSIDFHQVSTSGTGERAVGGRCEGLIEMGETVTWEARHLGVKQRLTTIIVEMDAPRYFCDEMLKGAFKSLRHEHYYEEKNGLTIMVDKMRLESPFGLVGKALHKYFQIGLRQLNTREHDLEKAY